MIDDQRPACRAQRFAGFVRAPLGSATPLLPRAMGDANELSANRDVQVVPAGRHRIVGGGRSRMGPDYAEPGDVAALNARIAELLADLNARPMRLYHASRRDLFERLDQPELRALPAETFVY